ncbi:MAG: hypothetical protein U0136_20795 [Bdellovibrionota bacterium]
MPQSQPDIHDAELILRVYELRREAVMRESRHALSFTFWPKSFAAIEAVMTQPSHPLNAAYRQVSGYWEMVYSFARRGVVDPDFFVENNGEGLFFFAKMAPYLAEIREKISPLAFRNTEWVATQCEEGRQRFAIVQKRIEALAASR